VLVNKPKSLPSSKLVPSATAAGSCQSSFDPRDLSSDAEEYLMPNNVAKMTPEQSDCAARLLTAAKLYLNSSPEARKNWGQIIPNFYNYHGDPMEFSSTLWLPDIANLWR